MIYNLESLSKDFNQLWSQLISSSTQIKCECGKNYSRDQDTSGNRRIRCRPCRKNYSVVNFIKKFIIPISEYDQMFEKVSNDYKTNYANYFDTNQYLPKIPTIPKIKHEKKPAESKENSKILMNLLSDNFDYYDSTSSEETISIEDSRIKKVKPNEDELVESTSKSKYNYSFKTKGKFDKDKYIPVYFYGIKFKDTKEFMSFIGDKCSQYKHMIKTCLLIGDNLVQVHILDNEFNPFVARMINIPEFDFVTSHIDRVCRALQKNYEQFVSMRRKEVDNAYSLAKDGYLYKFLY